MPEIDFDNSYAKLPDVFFTQTTPTAVRAPLLFKFNNTLAKELGLDNLGTDDRELAERFSGNKLFNGSEPISMAYAGHQFGGFAPQLGDGRAVQLGEIISPDGVRYDLQLKGSGLTPWSRGGDGRSALGPVIREYLLSEAMAKLGVPTTRALAAVTTGEQVIRESLLPGAILTRVSSGFVRVGTFEYFYRRNNHEAIKTLADYEIERHYKHARQEGNPYTTFFKGVVDRQAKLIAQWMQIGFIHGVMNTDNMSIAGETIDYGPCAFMDQFDNNRVYSSIDLHGRYAYSNQPKIGQWNLVRLAEALLPLFNDNQVDAIGFAEEVLNGYADIYQDYWLQGMCKKLGLVGESVSDGNKDKENLINELLALMDECAADFTLTFHCLTELADNFEDKEKIEKLTDLFTVSEATESGVMLKEWLIKWRARLAQDLKTEDALVSSKALMQSVNPIYIPRNHQVQAAITAAEEYNDFSVFNALHEVLQTPYDLQTGNESYMLPPNPEEVVHQTFCGT